MTSWQSNKFLMYHYYPENLTGTLTVAWWDNFFPRFTFTNCLNYWSLSQDLCLKSKWQSFQIDTVVTNQCGCWKSQQNLKIHDCMHVCLGILTVHYKTGLTHPDRRMIRESNEFKAVGRVTFVFPDLLVSRKCQSGSASRVCTFLYWFCPLKQ